MISSLVSSATNEIDLLENFARASNYKYDENTVKYGAGTLNYHAAAGDAADEDRDTWSRVNSYFNDKDSRYLIQRMKTLRLSGIHSTFTVLIGNPIALFGT